VKVGELLAALRLDDAGFWRDLRKVQVKVARERLTLRVDVDRDSLRDSLDEGLREQTRRPRREKVKIPTEPDLSGFSAEVRAYLASLSLEERVKVVAGLDRADFAKTLAEAKALAKRHPIRVPVEVDRNRLRRALTQMRADLNDAGGQFKGAFKEFGALAGAGGRLLSLLKLPALVAGLHLAAAALSATGAAATALLASLAPLAGLGPATASGLLAVGQAGGVASLALAGMGDVVKALGDSGPDAAKKLQEAIAALPPPARGFARELASLRPELARLRTVAAAGLFPGLTAALKDARGLLPAVRAGVAGTAGALGELARRAGAMTATPLFRRDAATIMAGNVRVIRLLGAGGLRLADALRHLLVAAQPLVLWLARLGNHLATQADHAIRAARASGALASFFARTRTVAGQLGTIVGNLGRILGDVLGAARPLGEHLLATLTRLTGQWAAFTGSAEGRRSIAQVFERARPAIEAVGRLLGDVTKAFAGLSGGTNLGPTIDQLRTQLLPVLVQVGNSVSGAFTPALISAVASVGQVFADLAGDSGTLNTFVGTIDLLARALHGLLTSAPGVQTATISLLAMAGAGKALKFASALSGLKGLASMAVGAGKGIKGLVDGFRRVEGAAGGAARAGSILRTLGAGAAGAATSVASAVGSVAAAVGRMVAAAAAAAARGAVAFAQMAAQAAAATGRVVAQVAIQVARWVFLGAQALANAARVAAAWLISLGPIAIVVAAVVAAVVLIIRNWSKIGPFLSRLWNSLKGIAARAWNAVKTAITGAVQAVLSWIRGHWPLILSILGGPVVAAAVLIVRNWDKIRAGARTAFEAVLSFLRGIPARIRAAVGNLGSTLLEAGKALIRGLINGVKSQLGALGRVLGGIGGFIADHKGPLPKDRRLLVPHGRAIMRGLLAGIDAETGALARALDRVGGQVAHARLPGPARAAAGQAAAMTVNQTIVQRQGEDPRALADRISFATRHRLATAGAAG
jgi:phage-related protein